MKGLAIAVRTDFDCFIKIEVKESKYRVSISNIKFKPINIDAGMIEMNTNFVLEDIVVRNNHNEIRKNKTARKTLERLNKDFINLLKNKTEKKKDLINLVNTVQIHKCSSYCQRKVKNSKKIICRGKFPREITNNTQLKIKFTQYGKYKLSIIPKTNHNYINNYEKANKFLFKLQHRWKERHCQIEKEDQ